MTEQEFLSRIKFGCGGVNEKLALPALSEFLASNGFHDAARVIDFMKGGYLDRIESLEDELVDAEASIERLGEERDELEKKLEKALKKETA
jgi:hypothetical protein